jgi:hypothetical protein
MFLIIWQFDVFPECAAAFEQEYGPDGTWAVFFQRSPDYLGTRLFRDTSAPGRYLTLDAWTSEEAFGRFERENVAEYQALDVGFERLTTRETRLGTLTGTMEDFWADHANAPARTSMPRLVSGIDRQRSDSPDEAQQHV